MDQIKNPFSPGAGSPPPELVGRDEILKKAKILLGRVQQKRSEKSFLMVGLRGMGKIDQQGDDLQPRLWRHGLHGPSL